MLFGCKSWVLNMLYIICYGVNNTIIMNSINYYAAYVLGESSAAMPILAVI
jgi:GPH family glycoside/pentoside/hexuronide:cation symporter